MRIRLIASFFLLVLVTIGVFFFVTVRQHTQEVRNFIARGGLTGSEQVVSVLEEYYLDNGTWEGVTDVLRRAPQVPRSGMWSSLNVESQAEGPRSGGYQAGRNQDQASNLAMSRTDLLLVDNNGNLVANTSDRALPLGEHLTSVELQRSVPLVVNGNTVGYLLREGGEVLTDSTQISLLTRLDNAAIVAMLVSGIVALILTLILSYSLVRPVRALQTAASRLATGDLSQRVQVKGKDELADLGRTFNQMAESLQNAEKSRRAMTADIAHELRNPLAVQRAHLEAIEDGVYPLSSDSLNTIDEQNRLLTRLVEDLRMLALADAGKLELERTLVDFPGLVSQVATRFEPQTMERQINLILSLNKCPPLMIDPQRIEQILHNLFSNAIRHTPQGGEIHCRISIDFDSRPGERAEYPPSGIATVNTCHLQIHDSGPGIPDEALPLLFDRFYRADKSRARSEGGTGLGLSIARKLAQAHGGDLSAANHPKGGAVFTLSLPIK